MTRDNGNVIVYVDDKANVSEHIKNIFDEGELEAILSSTSRKLLDNAGKISTRQAKEEALAEYRKYKAKNLSGVEEDYLDSIKCEYKLDALISEEVRHVC